MKKYLIILVLLFALVPCYSIRAADTSDDSPNVTDDAGINESGVFTHGVVTSLNNIKDCPNWKYDVTGNGIYVVRSVDGASAYISAGGDFKIQEYFSGDKITFSKSSLYSFDAGNQYAFLKIAVKDVMHFNIGSNFPIFLDDENLADNVKKYLENGDLSGAYNKDNLNTEDIDGSVEVPHGLKISGEFSFGTIQKVFHDKLLSFGWSLPEMENLTYDAQFKFNYLDKKLNSSGINSGWYKWRNNIKYNYDSAAMILDVVNKNQGVNWLASARTSLGLSMDDCYSITFRVRNRKGDKVSNWVEIQLGQDGKATARETDLNGNTQKSDEYNEDTNPSTNDSSPGSNDFYNWVKDKTDNSTNKDSDSTTNGLSSSVSDLKTFITSGFGLLGSNGIIALMSGLFSYIPASVWTLIKSAIAMTILIMLIGLIKNLVFG